MLHSGPFLKSAAKMDDMLRVLADAHIGQQCMTQVMAEQVVRLTELVQAGSAAAMHVSLCRRKGKGRPGKDD